MGLALLNRLGYNQGWARHSRATAMTENFKGLANEVGPPTRHALPTRCPRTRVHRRRGPDRPGSGLKDVDNFFVRYMTQVSSRSLMTDGIESIHTRFGHYWSVLGRPFTHPNSAAAWGVNIHNHNREVRRASVPGWYGQRACPVSAGSAVYGPVATTLNGPTRSAAPAQRHRHQA